MVDFSAAPDIVTSPVSKSAFDKRLVEVDLELELGQMTTFSELAIFASGKKYGSAIMNECELRIYNLTENQRNYILTQASPLKSPRTLINMNLRIGRESYGTFLLFTGNVISCNVTQPPDIGVTLRSLTCNFFTGTILGNTQPANTLLSVIAQSVADSFTPPLTLSFQATDKMINNYSQTGAATNGVDKLNQMGGVQAFIDNNTLIVIDSDKARDGDSIMIDETTGMIGIPQVTDQGVIVGVMVNNQIELGGSITVKSVMNPAANGTYKVVKINFEIANRDQPFWYVLECSNLAYYQGTNG